MRRILVLLLLAAVPAAAAAVPLQIARSAAAVADAALGISSRFLPGGDVDISLTVTNPLDNALLPVRNVVIEDVINPKVKLRVVSYTGNGGPVEFTDGVALGLLGSGLTYRFGGLGDATDSVDFYDGTTWGYTPVADSAGLDANVRKIRVTMTGTQATNSSFRLRYRTRVP